MKYLNPEWDRITRDLRWLATAPELISVTSIASKFVRDLIDCRALLEAPAIDSSQSDFAETSRLGIYFEQLCRYSLAQSEFSKLVAANQQIIHEKQTLGEFDLLLEFARELYHVELAVKFYLKVGNGDKLSDWVGPNLKDRFDVKYQHLLNHQLRLSEFPEVKEWLRHNKIQINKLGLLTRGRLYYPFSDFMGSKFTYPDEVCGDHLKGFWLTTKEFQEHKLTRKYQCLELPKSHWLSEVNSQEFSHMQLIDINTIASVTAIVLMHNDQELARGFVVPESWLGSALDRIRRDANS